MDMDTRPEIVVSNATPSPLKAMPAGSSSRSLEDIESDFTTISTEKGL
jgi:hypothetical protein